MPPASLPETDSVGQRATPPWLAGMGTLTFGLVAGFVITALPFLLSRAGISVDRIAGVSAVASSPTFWAFLLTPIVDVGFTRRTYALALTAASATSLTAALWFFSPDRLGLFTALVLIAEMCIVIQGSATSGWVSEFAIEADRGKIGGWTNAANLGGGAFGAMLLMSAAETLSTHSLAMLTAATVVASASFLLWLPKPVDPVFRLREVFGGTFRSILKTSRQPQVITGFLLFLAPASCLAAINLFAGLGNDFHAAAQRVVWVTGAGVAIASATGAILGGYIADRIERGMLYLGGGMLAALVSLWMAFTPHTQAAFTVGVLTYNFIAGICYAAFSALGYQLTGNRNPSAATQMALFAAASNAAIVYMTWLDGQGYRFFGVRGLFVVDGLASLGAAIPLIFVVRRRLRR
jgi:PAT family beta-lactamase induction signal transducer AmpG